MRQGSRQLAPRIALALAVCLCLVPARGRAQTNTASDAAKSAWSTGGASATAKPTDPDGKPAAAAGQTIPYWQVPALPTAVIQGGSIPPGWQPQAIPYQGIGPDGRPFTHYYAPTYTFTYQVGPPVLAVPQAPVNRPQAPRVPYAQPSGAGPYPPPSYAPGWNYQTQGVPPPTAALPPATVARYAPPPYQFPPDSRALAGTPIMPPAAPAYASAPPVMAAAPATAPPLAPPPSQWMPSSESAPGFATAPPPPAASEWASVAPPAIAGAAGVAAGAAIASQSQPVPVASLPPPVAPVPTAAAAAPASLPVQPVSSGGLAPLQPPSSRSANSHLWRVVGVHDGDTVTCIDDANQQQKVRLAEIDAPEVSQDFGKVSREALAGMVFGKTIEVVDSGKDRYGRWIGHLYVDGMDVNRQMVATGNAWHYADYSKDKSLAAVQAQAQAQRIGLWSQPNPMPPWDYRKNGKKK